MLKQIIRKAGYIKNSQHKEEIQDIYKSLNIKLSTLKYDNEHSKITIDSLNQEIFDYKNEINSLKSQNSRKKEQLDDYIKQSIKEGRDYRRNIEEKYCIPCSDFSNVDDEKAKEEMIKVLNENNLNVWTEAQSKMIFSKSRFVNVIAGAGSGKTTTMILRIIYMIKYLNIDIDQITVITFTTSAREDFSNKLAQMMSAFGEDYTYKYLHKNVVKTFHAKMLDIIRYCGLEIVNFEEQIFEHLDSKNNNQTINNNNNDSDNLFDLLEIKDDISSSKYDYLMQCYFDLYRDNKKFKTVIDYIYKNKPPVKLPYRENNKTEKEILYDIEKDDLVQTKSINEFCNQILETADVDIPNSQCIPFEFELNIPRETSKKNITGTLHANYYLENSNIYIIVLPEKSFVKNNHTWDNIDQNILKETKKKFLWLQYWVNSKSKSYASIFYIKDFEFLKYILKIAKQGDIAPTFNIAITGETNYPKMIFKSLYSLGSYFESLNLSFNDIEFKDLYKKVNKNNILTGLDSKILEATVIYFKGLRVLLRENKIYRYNELFQESGAVYNPRDNVWAAEDLYKNIDCLQHVLIDEFQDISPLIASWVRYYLHYNHAILKRETSLMSIGDNWQCIYGFRGSVPTYLSRDYKKIFPVQQNETTIYLRDNFRSAQRIIDNAQKVFPSDSIKERGGISQINIDGRFFIDSNILIYKYSHQDKQCTDQKEIKYYLEQIFHEYKSYQRKSKTDYSVFILCTTGDLCKKAKKNLFDICKSFNCKIPDHFKIMTIHKSKGLEAECVVVIGDKVESNIIPLKCVMYSYMLGEGFCHQTSLLDEYKNLIYVAISRAKLHAILLINQKDKGIAYKAFKKDIKEIQRVYLNLKKG